MFIQPKLGALPSAEVDLQGTAKGSLWQPESPVAVPNSSGGTAHGRARFDVGGGKCSLVTGRFVRLIQPFDWLELLGLTVHARSTAAASGTAKFWKHAGRAPRADSTTGEQGWFRSGSGRTRAGQQPVQHGIDPRVIGSPASLTFDPWDNRSNAVRTAYETQLGRVSASQLSFSLVKIVEYLGGTRLRPSGAVYWIPGPKLDEWSQVAQAIEQAAEVRPSAVYVLRHKLDADAVRAVRDALVAEVQDEATRIRDEVLSGELGGRALVTRKNQVCGLRSKVLLYEEILEVGLNGLHKAIDEADQAAVTAAIMLSGIAPDVTAVAAD